MRIYQTAFALLLLIAMGTAGSSQRQSKLIVHFFGSSTCGECLEIKESLLEPLRKKYADKLEIRLYNIDSDTGLQALTQMEKAYKVGQSYPQALFLPDTFLTGYDDIIKKGKSIIEAYIASPEKWTAIDIAADASQFHATLEDRVRSFTFLGILAAGLVDGINPCAIATLIFLISFLAAKKRSQPEILGIGLTFTAAVFVTYLLLGLGAFKILTMLKSYSAVSAGIKWLAVVVAGGVGLMQFRDAFVYKRGGKAAEMKMQLPKAVKLQIHKVISMNLTGTRLIIGSIITGFLVTLLEAVCTGQVYLPTIVLMTHEGSFKLRGWMYLIFYNFLFVLPLLAIMILAYMGLTWSRLSKSVQRHLALLKILLGIVLVSLAIFLGVAG